jgi:hypothetical protein
MNKLIVSFFTIAILCAAARAFAADGSGLEGEYVESGVENSTLTITADHWTLGGTMKMDYTYTAKKTGENTYELELKTANRYMKGMDMKTLVRKEGNALFVNNNGAGEIKYEKKK